ncbi:hypothetical protein H4Q26_000528 [Puccinia striiformis f. sp. tritici PST-130]|nr:hypothetical protein H4Q26_000528 [Puccinia striiformis f. sp. tritici PST-130]
MLAEISTGLGPMMKGEGNLQSKDVIKILRRLRLASYWQWLDTKSRDQRSSLIRNYLLNHGLSSQSTTQQTSDEPEQLEEEYTSLLSVQNSRSELSLGSVPAFSSGKGSRSWLFVRWWFRFASVFTFEFID